MNNPTAGSGRLNRLRDLTDDYLPDGNWFKWALTVLLVYYAGLTCEETAEATGVPSATVRTRMFHARKKLQSALEKSAVPEIDKGAR